MSKKSALMGVAMCILILLCGVAASVAAQRLGASDMGTWHSYTTGNDINDLLAVGDYVWAGTGGGVVRWNRLDGTYTKYLTTDGLADNVVNAVAIDLSGRMWFGTNTGASVYDGSTWTTYTTDDGLAMNGVHDIAVDGAGVMWFATYGGVGSFDGTTWRYRHGTASSMVNTVVVDAQDRKWFGTNGYGVSVLDGETWTTYSKTDGLVDDHVVAIAQDESGSMWLGTYRGVSELDPWEIPGTPTPTPTGQPAPTPTPTATPDPGPWDQDRISAPRVIHDVDGYRMWYDGLNTEGIGWGVGLARSSDGCTWSKHSGNPVLVPGVEGHWYSYGRFQVSVIKESANYKMWFSASAGGPWQTGYATSSDGVEWNVYAGNSVRFYSGWPRRCRRGATSCPPALWHEPI